MTLTNVKNHFDAVKHELGVLLYYLLWVIFIVNALFMFWVPANDFDTMSSYLARIKLEEFGPLKNTATLEIQYLFPKFFDYLHAPFLKLGYFTTFPNFFLFSIVLFILICKFPTKQAAWGLLFLFFCPSILLTIAAAKNDITLGLLGLLAWYVISYMKESRFYVVVSLSLISMLMGTKWHGIILAAPLSLYLVYNIYLQGSVGLKKLLIALFFLPLFYFFSSFNVYWENYQNYGTFFPHPDYLITDLSFKQNLLNFVPSQILDTLEPPYHLVELLLKGSVSAVTYGFGKDSRSLLMASSDFNSCGVLLIIVLLISIYLLFKKDVPLSVRIAAFLCVFYFLCIQSIFTYNTFRNRYFLASYLFGVIPAIYLLKNSSPKKYQWILLALFAVFSSYAVLFNGEKRLVPIRAADNGDIIRYKTMYPHLLDRDMLYFNLWDGYGKIFLFMREKMDPHLSLVIVNFAKDGDTPFLYPLIKDRYASNTRIINLRNKEINPLEVENSLTADFVMTYRKPIKNNQYQLVFDLDSECNDICIFKRVDIDQRR